MYNVQDIPQTKAPTGTSSSATLRRLRKHAIDEDTDEIVDERIHALYQRVLADEISPSAAMIEAGFRKRMISIPVEDAERAARSICANASPESIRELATALFSALDSEAIKST